MENWCMRYLVSPEGEKYNFSGAPGGGYGFRTPEFICCVIGTNRNGDGKLAKLPYCCLLYYSWLVDYLNIEMKDGGSNHYFACYLILPLSIDYRCY